jgi:coenzyme Q-binding protein COQ10
MSEFSTRRRVPHSPLEMLELVAKVEDYPKFLPLCEALTVRSRQVQGGREILVADMTAGYGAIHETFKSRVTIDREASPPRVLVEYLDGPFRYLENRWTFLPAPGGGCTVDFFIRYEFKSMMLQILVGAVFDKAFRRFTEAFEERARQVYGPLERGAVEG